LPEHNFLIDKIAKNENTNGWEWSDLNIDFRVAYYGFFLKTTETMRTLSLSEIMRINNRKCKPAQFSLISDKLSVLSGSVVLNK
jgi:hypothetical protein